MKIQDRNKRLTTLLFAAGISVMAARAANAAPLNLADTPLFLASGAEPNIMMMIDSSGSMENIVPDAPFVATTNYAQTQTGVNCTGGSLVSTGTEVIINVVSGSPRVRIGGTDYRWGITTTSPTTVNRRCFSPTGNYIARLNLNGTGFLGAQYTGNFLNWYFNTATDPATGCTNTWSSGRKPCTQSRMMIARTAGKSLVDSMPGGVRAGLSRYSDSSGAGGQLLTEIGQLDATLRTTLKDDIDDIVSAGNTPLAETLADIGYYFSQGATNLTLHPGGTPTTATRAQVFEIPTTPSGSHTRNSTWTTGTNPISVRCQKSFAVLLTDGRPTTDRHLPSRIRDYTGDCGTAGLCNATPTGNNITSPVANLTAATTAGNGVKVGRSYETNGSDYLDDIAAALYDMDLRPDLTKTDPAEKNNLVTYLITFADDQAKNDPLMQSAATHGGGQKYIAGNEAELVAAFQNALADIEAQIGSASSASVNSGSINSDTRLFQATFDSSDWSGELFARAVSKEIRDPLTGAITTREGTLGVAVDATIPSPDSRTVITVNGTTSADFTGVPFRWSASDPNVLDANRKAELWSAARDLTPGVPETDAVGISRVAWLRGARTDEAPNGLDFRKRADGTVLGDIINSAPAFVGAPNFRYPDDLESGANRKYSAFRTANLNRDHMVYVGANDGMLHAFHTIDTSDTGAVTETLAFIPKTVFKNLYKLTDPGYSHTYFTDGSPVVGDAYINGQWRTMLVAGLNKGGQGVYALDITDPGSFNEANADSIFKWEFTDAEDADLGYTYSRPSIIRMNDGKWYAAFGNGYNNTVDDDADGATTPDSTSGNAVLYFVDLETGEMEHKIDTGIGTADDPSTTVVADKRPNGLSTPVFVDINGDYNVDLAYAGDLFGNLWKFDLSSASSSGWEVAYDEPLFQARNEGHIQPITSRPNVSRGPNGVGLVVLFGTGKYIENGDTNLANLHEQTFYGLHDANTGASTDVIGGGRADLLEQTITYQSTTGQLVRVTSATDLDTDEDRGWFMDLPGTGEMQVTDSLIRNNHVVFTTLIPETDACAFGGSSWLMEVNLFSGARATTTPFDLNNNQIFDDMVDTNGSAAGGELPVSGVQTTVGITPKPAPLAGKRCDHLIFPGTKPGTETRCRDPGPRGYGRQSWRQAH